MPGHTVEIGDTKGRSFRIQIELPTYTPVATVERDWLSMRIDVKDRHWSEHLGSWRTIDKGFITHNSGSAVRESNVNNDPLHIVSNLVIGVSRSYGSAVVKHARGIWLDGFEKKLNVQKQGTGLLLPVWGMAMKGGPISWVLIPNTAPSLGLPFSNIGAILSGSANIPK